MMTSPRQLVRRISARPTLSIVTVGMLAFLVSATLSFLRPPVPRVHDEFSYLLAADTFSSGRWTNPRHPLWPYFETFHVLQSPTYASKYPPIQGIFLAAGQSLTGSAIVGSWVGVSLGCASVCWMLYGWTRPRWAFLGGILAALHHGIHGGIRDWGTCYSWSQSFWGGGPAMLGGALVLGGWARWMKQASARNGLWIALGTVILANSRPFEGMLVCLPVFASMIRRRFLPGEPPVVCLTTCLVIFGVSGALMAHYNRAVTGSALSLPYSAYEKTYNPAPIFVAFQSLESPPAYRHEVLRRFFVDWCSEQVNRQSGFRGWASYHRERLEWLHAFFVGPLVLPFLMLPLTLRRQRCRQALALIVAILGVHLLTVGIQPHYAAPVAGCFFLLVVEGMRRLATLKIGGFRYGSILVRLTLFMVLSNLLVIAVRRVNERPGWDQSRARIEAALQAGGGRHVVIVRYTSQHDLLHEWVENRADIDGAQVIWAREMDEMRGLIDYYPRRTFWVVDADAEVPSLRELPEKSGLSP